MEDESAMMQDNAALRHSTSDDDKDNAALGHSTSVDDKDNAALGHSTSVDDRVLFVSDAENIRIDKYVSEKCPDFTRTAIQKLLDEGNIFLENQPDKIPRASYRLKTGDRIVVRKPEQKELEILPENIPLDILYEDSDLLIVNKPKGMVVHPSGGHSSGTLVNAVLFHCQGNLSGINGVIRPGIVHRIDQDTTGSLIICKNDRAHNRISEQLKCHSITRKYIAIVHGNLKDESGTISGVIGRDPNDRKKMSVNCKNGKRAVTHYTVLEHLNGYDYVECTLETGRTHQIRVHMASIGHPILGDSMYGPSRCPVKHLQGQTLHAKTIGFIHPTTGEYMEFEAPVPEYFSHLITALKM